ncbi:hypothetical protein STEG23_012028 [Scotinomys teguina]
MTTTAALSGPAPWHNGLGVRCHRWPWFIILVVGIDDDEVNPSYYLLLLLLLLLLAGSGLLTYPSAPTLHGASVNPELTFPQSAMWDWSSLSLPSPCCALIKAFVPEPHSANARCVSSMGASEGYFRVIKAQGLKVFSEPAKFAAQTVVDVDTRPFVAAAESSKSPILLQGHTILEKLH